MRFRKIRRNHAHWKSTQASDGGADEARAAGRNAGTDPFGTIADFGGVYRNGFANAGNYQLAAQMANAANTQSAYSYQMQNAQAAHAQKLLNANNMLVLRQQMQFAQMKAQMAAGYGLSPVMSFGAPDPLPREIRAGEIIGYRAWLMGSDGSYWSMVNPVEWTDKRMDGAIGDEHGAHSGVHAWRTLAQAFDYAKNYRTLGFPIAIGEVLLWGDVVEHVDGYRAEHAEIGKIHETAVTTWPAVHSPNFMAMYAHIPGACDRNRPTTTAAPIAKPFGDLLHVSMVTVSAFLLALAAPHIVRALFN